MKKNLLKRFTAFFGILLLISFSQIAYSQICPPGPVNELVKNGDFKLGNNGDFGSAFPYSSGAVGPGQYTIGTNPNASNSYFANISDHSPGDNNMLIIDVPDNAVDLDVYNTTTNAPVNIGQTYFFSAWFANINTNTSCSNCGGVYFENAPHLEFYINGKQIGATVKVDSATHGWAQFFVQWKSDVSTVISIQIKNVKPGSGGNDLALDDISFSTSCKGITNLSSLGKSSILPDTIYACNESLPITLDPKLGSSKYTFEWKNSSGGALASPNTGATYSFSSAPAAGKYYLCYDSIADNTLCPRTDSVIVVNELKVNISPDQVLCDPINYTINSNITAPGITFKWERNSTPLTTSIASHQAVADGTYKLTVSKSGCPPASGSMKITKIVPTMTGTGTYCGTSTPKEATFSVKGANKIGGNINIEWYNVATGGSKLTTTIKNDSTINVKSPNFVSIPGVCDYGLYADDKNSFNTGVTQGPLGNISATNSTTYTMITVKGTPSLSLNSIDFIQKNYNNGGLVTYTVKVYASQTGSSCGKNNIPLPSTVINANAGSITVTQTSTATARTIPLNITLPGSAAGINYWIEITGGEVGYSADAKPYGTVINNSPGQTVLMLGDTDDNGCFNSKKGVVQSINATVGKTNSCGRVFVCATTENCALPVEFLNVEAKTSSSGNIITWSTAWELNNKLFIVQKSADGKTFSNIGQVAGSGTSNSINKYSFLDVATNGNGVIYYRIIQIDFNGASDASKIVSAENSDSENLAVVFPVPSKKGEPVTFVFSDKSPKTLKISDLYGKTIFTGNIGAEDESYSLNLDLPSGVYLAEIKTESNLSALKKLIIE